MKKLLLLICLSLSFVAAKAQTMNCTDFCVLAITIDTTNEQLEVTIASDDSAVFVNYPVVRVVNTNGDTVGNIDGYFYFFGQAPGDTLVHQIPTTLDSLPSPFICTVYLTDYLDSSTCMLSYPAPCTINTGISEQYINTNFSVYPNPANDIITINNNARQSTFVMYNSIGQTIDSWQLGNGSRTIDISSYPSGIYFITSVSDGNRIMKKIVKQ